MWIAIGLGLFVLAALFLIAVALHDDIEQTIVAMLMFGLLSFVGTIIVSALTDGKVPNKASLIESAQIGLLFAFGMAVIGLLGLVVSAPIRMISRAIATRNCATCALYHDRLHQPATPPCPECTEYHEQDHDTDQYEEDLEEPEYEDEPVRT